MPQAVDVGWGGSSTSMGVFLRKISILGCEMGGNPPVKETPKWLDGWMDDFKKIQK